MKSKKKIILDILLSIVFIGSCFLVCYISDLKNAPQEAAVEEPVYTSAVEPETLTKLQYGEPASLWLSRYLYEELIYCHSYFYNSDCFVYEIAVTDGLYACRNNFESATNQVNYICRTLHSYWEETPYNMTDIEVWLLNDENLEQVLLVSHNGTIDYYLETYYDEVWWENDYEGSEQNTRIYRYSEEDLDGES